MNISARDTVLLEETLVRAVERRLVRLAAGEPVGYTQAWQAGWDAAAVTTLASAIALVTGERVDVVLDRATDRARGAAPSRGPIVCPRCGAPGLAAVHDGELTNFFCDACGWCWHVGLGYVYRVDPATCPGCPLESRCRPTDDTAIAEGPAAEREPAGQSS